MADREFVDDELSIDWDHLLDNIPDDLNFDFCDLPTADGFSASPDSGCSLSIDDIEQYLLNDDSNHPKENDQNIIADGFFSDVLLDSSPGSGSDRSKDSSASPESVEVETDEEEKEEDKPHQDGADVPQTKKNSVVDVVDDDGDDPVAKKRKRQMRNRDAAVRSRERKKMYVRDLEMKSKYYEAECKRLGILLQCCLAENQALRLSLHNSKAFDASMTKQESAVLLLESLLLGSLLGFLGILCLLILPSQLLSTLEAGLLENVESAEWESVAPRKAGSKVFRVPFHSFMMGKRCKASRSRMKLMSSATEVIL
ncbi:hypothetical protein Pfo_016578 [Paulownia fortunei]|nr:hypothetical protein Pfo_016578 [Paulownia fortunei]